MRKPKLYKGDVLCGKPVYYVYAGEKRPPKKGEMFLSGAFVRAYEAPNDLTTPYMIARLARDDEMYCECCGQFLSCNVAE